MKPLAFFIVLTAVAIWNWYIIRRKKRSPNHRVQAIVRMTIWGIISLWFFVDDFWETFIAFHLAFWLPFDTLLNVLRKKPLLYIGDPSDPEEDSWLDTLGHKWPDAFFYTRLLFLIAGMAMLIIGLGY